MNSIEGLPNSNGKSIIMVNVSKFSKYAHFIALSHPYFAKEEAKHYFDHVVKLLGLLKNITCDRYIVFTSNYVINVYQNVLL